VVLKERENLFGKNEGLRDRLPRSRKVVRGGSWAEAITTIRWANRSDQEGNAKRATIGFRVVAEAK